VFFLSFESVDADQYESTPFICQTAGQAGFVNTRTDIGISDFSGECKRQISLYGPGENA
jgi:hypothetical protein